MRLSTRARYGLRAMTALARRSGGLVTSEALAVEEGVSKRYLDSILGRLREAGLLTAAAGARGGYALARRPEEISAAEVVEVLDGEVSIVPCVKDPGSCERAERCPTRPVWAAASAAVERVLGGITLADLAGGGRGVGAMAMSGPGASRG